MNTVTTFSSAVRGVKAPGSPSRIRRVEAVVTLATLAWFAATLAGAFGELHGDRPAPGARVEAARDLLAAPRQAAMEPGKPAHATISLI